MYAGGSGEYKTTQVRLIVLPLSMYSSGPPIISVVGSVNKSTLCVICIIQSPRVKEIRAGILCDPANGREAKLFFYILH